MYLAEGSYALSLINLYFPRLVPSCFITIVLQRVTSLHFFSNVTGIFVFTLQFTDWGERSTCVPEGCILDLFKQPRVYSWQLRILNTTVHFLSL